MKRLMNVKEASEFLNINPYTLYNWVSQKRIPYVKLGRRTLFDLNDLEEFISSNKVSIVNYD